MQAMAMTVIDNVEEEDDLSPLKAALDKANERLKRLETKREKHETEALEVAELAISQREALDVVCPLCAANAGVDTDSNSDKQKFPTQYSMQRVVISNTSAGCFMHAKQRKIAEASVHRARHRRVQVKAEVKATEHTLHKREEQLQKMAQQRENIQAELAKYRENDGLASVDMPAKVDAASVGARAGCACHACMVQRFGLPLSSMCCCSP